MLKILLIDSSNDGHHIPYLKGIVDGSTEFTYFFVLPKGNYVLPGMTFEYQNSKHKFDLLVYLDWINFIKKICKRIHPNIVCFLYGDIFYKRFGFGLKWFNKNFRVIAIFHQFRKRIFMNCSLKRIFKEIEIGIVHTKFNYRNLASIGITNVQQIEYPQLYPFKQTSIIEARDKLGLPKGRTILAAMGSTSYYKGLDFLLEAMTFSNGKYDPVFL